MHSKCLRQCICVHKAAAVGGGLASTSDKSTSVIAGSYDPCIRWLCSGFEPLYNMSHCMAYLRCVQCACHQLHARARKLPPGISTSWLMGIGQFRWGVPIDPFRGGVPGFSGRTGRNTPSFWAKISISRSKTLSKFPKIGACGPKISTRR
jgi:hypothetical protein